MDSAGIMYLCLKKAVSSFSNTWPDFLDFFYFCIKQYWVRHEFLLTFEFAAIFLFELYRQTIKGKKYAQDKDKTEKTPKSEVFSFLGNFFEPKMGTLKTIRAFMYWPKSVRL